MERFCPECEATYPANVKRCSADGVPTMIVSQDHWARFKGRVLDERWELGELIGQGGMGAVFRGTQLKLQRAVAIKILRKEISDDRESIGRFFREARILSALQHPHIVTMLDFGQDEDTGCLYMVMELLQGRSLAEWLSTGEAIGLRQILVMVEQLAFALSEAHEQGVIHRDLKPENLFLTRDDTHLVVLDFGIAKVTDDSVTRLTKTGYIQGTPAYMSPEQAQGRPVGPQTDLYAIGVLLYELLSGYEPFRATNVMQVLMQHISADPEPLAERWLLAEPLRPDLVALTHELLAKSPDDRPPSAAALRERALAIIADVDANPSSPDLVARPRLTPRREPSPNADHPPGSTPDPWPGTASHLRPRRGAAAPKGGPSAPTLGPGPAPPTLSRDWPVVLAGAGLVVLLGLGAVGAWLLSQGGGDDVAVDRDNGDGVAVERVEEDPSSPDTAAMVGEHAPRPSEGALKDEPDAAEAKQDDESPDAAGEEAAVAQKPEEAAATPEEKARPRPGSWRKRNGSGGRAAPAKPAGKRKLDKLLDDMRSP